MDTSDTNSVVRQGTFDTDPNLARAGRADIHLPHIDADGAKNSRKASENEKGKRSLPKVPSRNDTNLSPRRDDRDADTRSINSTHETSPTFVLTTPSPGRQDKKPPAGKGNRSLSKTDESKTDNMDRPGNRSVDSYEAMYQERNTLLNAEKVYKRRIKQLEDESNSFLAAIEDLNAENKLLRSRVDLLELELKPKGDLTTVDRAVRAEGAKAELEDKVKVLEKQLKDKEDEENADGSKDHLQTQIRDLKAQVIKLQTDNQDINEENIKLKSEHLEQVKKLHALEKEKLSLATSVTDVESEKLDKIKDLEKDHTRLKKEVKGLKDTNADLKKKLDALEFENKTLSETLTQKKSELSELLVVMKEENKFDNEIKELKAKLKQAEDEKREQQMQHNIDLRKLNEELDDTKSVLEETAKLRDELKVNSDEMETEYTKFKSENQSLTDIVEKQKQVIEELTQELERLRKELHDEREKYKKLKDETENAQSDMSSVKEELETTNKELQQVVSDKEGQVSKLIAQLDSLRDERKEEKERWKENKDNLNAEIQRLVVFEKNMGRMEQELKHFVDSLEDSETRKKQLASQLADKENTVSFFEQQVFELNLKLETMKRRFNDKHKENNDIEMEKREWEVKRDKVYDIESSNKRLLEENRRLRSVLDGKTMRDPKEPKPAPIAPPEPWVGEAPLPLPSQRAVYVGQEERKKAMTTNSRPPLQHALPGRLQTRRAPFSKSSPPPKSKTVASKRDTYKSTISPSKSLEDLRRSVENSPASQAPQSLPDIKQDNRLTYGGIGYRAIHRNRIRAAQKHVF